MRFDRPRAVGWLALAPLVAFAGTVIAQTPRRVDTAVALAQIIKKVEPVVPPTAVMAKVGGPVVADVTVGPTGTVTDVRILSGPPMLHISAERALRQWTFKPFLSAGRPHSVQVVLEVSFPDPAKDEENRIYETYRASTYSCQRQLQADPTQAEPLCAEAVRATNALPADRVLERSHAIGDHAHVLILLGRFRAAISEFERALEIRSAVAKGPDADNADIHQILANLHARLDETGKADAEFAKSIETYMAAIERLPAMRQLYEPRLRQALVSYAALQRSQGNTAAAAALESRAAAISTESDPAGIAESGPRQSRTVGQLQIVEPPEARLAPADIEEIAGVLRRAGRDGWLLDAALTLRGNAPRSWFVHVFEKPEIASSKLRRGSVGIVTCEEAKETGCRGWKYGPASAHYVQVAGVHEDAASEPPILIEPSPNLPPPSDDDVISMVKWVRDHAAAAPTERRMLDIQPWPIEIITGWGTSRVRVYLRDPAHAGRTQSITLERKNGEWTAVEMR